MKSKWLGNIMLCLGYFNSFLNGLYFHDFFLVCLDITVKLISLKCCLMYYFLLEDFKSLQWLWNKIESLWLLQTSSNLSSQPLATALAHTHRAFQARPLPTLPTSVPPFPTYLHEVLLAKMHLSWFWIPLFKKLQILRTLICSISSCDISCISYIPH